MSSSTITNLVKKIDIQQHELDQIRERLQIAERKIDIIIEVDRIKSLLLEVNNTTHTRPFRKIIQDESLRDEIESIFNAPYDQCLSIYNDLLRERNQVVHFHTRHNWKQTRKNYSESLKSILRSLGENN